MGIVIKQMVEQVRNSNDQMFLLPGGDHNTISAGLNTISNVVRFASSDRLSNTVATGKTTKNHQNIFHKAYIFDFHTSLTPLLIQRSLLSVLFSFFLQLLWHTTDISMVVKEAKKNIEIKKVKTSIVHVDVGKPLCENAAAFVHALLQAKHAGLNRKYAMMLSWTVSKAYD
ncbi:60S ribosomal protein L11 [Tanacetum coccineum]